MKSIVIVGIVLIILGVVMLAAKERLPGHLSCRFIVSIQTRISG